MRLRKAAPQAARNSRQPVQRRVAPAGARASAPAVRSAGCRCLRGRSWANGLCRAVHHVPRHAGARHRHGREPGAIGARAERSRGQSARAFHEEGPPDAERRAELDADRRANRGPHALSPSARERRAARLADVRTRRTSSPAMPKAGEAYFKGEGKCTQCHSATGDLAGIGRPLDPVNFQQRFMFPFGRGGARGARAGRARPPRRGHDRDDHAGVRRGDDRPARADGRFHRHVPRRHGVQRTVRRVPGMKVVKNNPLAVPHRSARTDHRQEHARRRRLPGDTEMKRLRIACSLRLSLWRLAVLRRHGADRPRSGAAAEAGDRLLADATTATTRAAGSAR